MEAKQSAKLSNKDLNQSLWSAADEMRKVMAADVYKDYLLGLVFFKNLSDKVLQTVSDLLERPDATLEEAQSLYENAKDREDWDALLEEIRIKYNCVIAPEHTFQAFYKKINLNSFMLSELRQAFREIESEADGAFEGLFEDFDIDSKDLGKTPDKRNQLISSVIKALSNIDFSNYQEDGLGDAYEYLIAQFASESGKKAGEFYTPQSVSEILARIVTQNQSEKFGFTVYDPAMGSGSLLLRLKHHIKDSERLKNSRNIHFFGQELKNQTYNLARMNMILHQVPYANQHLRNGDTLDVDWPTDEPTNFDAVVMNPPYSQKYDAKEALLTDPRFSPYKKLAPASKADMAFLLHGLYHLKDSGTMGIVLPHGVLFRGAGEKVIRQTLVEKGNIYAVIGLPPGIFFSTGIPTCILVLKKNRISRDILFIDASKGFRKEKAKNVLEPSHIDEIVKAYQQRKDIENFARVVDFEEIQANDFNLNIPRYVDTSEPEIEVDLSMVFKDLRTCDLEIANVEKDLDAFFKELGLEFSFSGK